MYTSKFAKNVNIESWKSEVDKLDSDKLVIDKLLVLVPVDLSKLSDVVKVMLLKKRI